MQKSYNKLYDPDALQNNIFIAFDNIKQPKVRIWGIFGSLVTAKEAIEAAGRMAWEFKIVSYIIDYRLFYHQQYGNEDSESSLHEVEMDA